MEHIRSHDMHCIAQILLLLYNLQIICPLQLEEFLIGKQLHFTLGVNLTILLRHI